MVSLRDFSREFGAVVSFDSYHNAISISLGYHMVEMVPYSTTAWIDGNPVALDNPVVIVDDVTYLPLRFLSHAFNMNATWENNNQQVIIVSPANSQRVQWNLDLNFGQRPHVYQRNYTPDMYRNMPRPPQHGGPPTTSTGRGGRPGGGPPVGGHGPGRGGHGSK